MRRVIGDWTLPEYRGGITTEQLEEKYAPKPNPHFPGFPSVGGRKLPMGFGGIDITDQAEAWEAYMELGTAFERSVRGEHGFHWSGNKRYDPDAI